MGNNISINRINFKDMQYAINNNMKIINTLDINNQDCLIKNTLSPEEEVNIINGIVEKKLQTKIIIYGENSSDDTLIKKYYQLRKLGIKNIYVYVGGLFEWLLLQDIYGEDIFPTSSTHIDILKYSGDISHDIRYI